MSQTPKPPEELGPPTGFTAVPSVCWPESPIRAAVTSLLPQPVKGACSEPILAMHMNLSLCALGGTLLGWQKLGSILGTWALLGAIGDTKMTKMG